MACSDNKRIHVKNLRKQTLAIALDLYLFPQSPRSVAQTLRRQFPTLEEERVRDCFTYLEMKGYLKVARRRGRLLTATITADGVDLAEGAVTDKGVLPVRADLTGLSARRDTRARILAYCRQFPDSFSGDDEILAELKELGFGAVIMEQVRFHIWYLAGKGLLEMKTHPLQSDLVYLAKITAKGMDLIDGAITDPGVADHESGVDQ